MTAKKIAIACQGGGINAAFTYGVLRKILETAPGAFAGAGTHPYRIVAVSGTSAGALCAFATWYGLADKGDIKGSPQGAIATLDDLWQTFAAQTPGEILFNRLAVEGLKAQGLGFPMVRLSPYSVMSAVFASQFPALGLRPAFYDFHALLSGIAPDLALIDQARTPLRLLVGAVEILSGDFEAFDSWADPASGRTISLEAVMASGTLPEVRKAERLTTTPGGERTCDGYYWDGLFSQNPPIKPLLSNVGCDDRPDEIWVVRINPQRRDTPPQSLQDIEDRRNELAGNLSLNQELGFIASVNSWCRSAGDFAKDHKVVTVRTIKMSKATSDRLDVPTKFDRSQAFIADLKAEGEARAAAWLGRWPDVGTWPADTLYGPGDD